MDKQTIQGMAVEFGQPGGTVTVERLDGATMLDLVVTDESGQQVTVYLGFGQTTELMVALGAGASEL
jgi:hypothetical protein